MTSKIILPNFIDTRISKTMPIVTCPDGFELQTELWSPTITVDSYYLCNLLVMVGSNFTDDDKSSEVITPTLFECVIDELRDAIIEGSLEYDMKIMTREEYEKDKNKLRLDQVIYHALFRYQNVIDKLIEYAQKA